MIWWTVLFAVLPIGVRTQGEDGAVVPGTPESAPTAPRLLRVVLLTTVISTLLFLLPWGAYALRSRRSAAMDRAVTLPEVGAETKRARPTALL